MRARMNPKTFHWHVVASGEGSMCIELADFLNRDMQIGGSKISDA